MNKHILIEKAYVYDEIKDVDRPKNCYYDRENGFWRCENDDAIMMMSDTPQKPSTKKCDIETGEDQKGE